MERIKVNTLRLFLLLYLGVLILHICQLNFNGLTPFLLLSGAGFALLAHLRKDGVSIVLLCIHMSLEWYEHSLHGWHYSSSEWVLHSIHATFDFLFLTKEIFAISTRFGLIFLPSILAVIFSIYSLNLVTTPKKHPFTMTSHTSNHSHGNHGPVKTMILGGMLGCVISHVFIRKRKKEGL